MNSFELRQQQRKSKLAKRNDDRAFAAFLETVGVQSFFEDAFMRLYGRQPNLTYTGGWFYLQGKRTSRKKLMVEAQILWAKLQEQEIEYESEN
jgi:hypothetical protein